MSDNVDKKELGRYLKDVVSKAATGNSESVQVDGGSLVGKSIVGPIFNQLESESPIFNKVKKVVVLKGPTVKIHGMVNEQKDEPTTGLRAYWSDEADSFVASTIKFSGYELDLNRLSVRIPATNELITDCTEFANAFLESANQAVRYKVEKEILMGMKHTIHGVAGKGDEATITVSTSADITEAEIKAYVAKLHPSAYKNAEWYITPQQYDNIISINYTTDNILNFESRSYYLAGFKVNVIPQLVGTPYHVILGDFTKYTIVYIDPKFSTSDDIRFNEGEKEFRLALRIAGHTYAENSALDDGNTYGFFIVPAGGEADASSSSSDSSSTDSSSTSSSSYIKLRSTSSATSNSSSSSSSI
jgi:HK97 family phage major capsid protein